MKNGYIRRMVDIGIPYNKAYDVYRNYIRNFSIPELEVYVRYLESK